jgi:hypothetical protein
MSTEPLTPDQEYRDLIDDTIRAAARLARAVGWLLVLAEPGREPRPSTRPANEDQVEVRTAAWYREQAEQARARRLGLAGSDRPWGGPSAAPARVALLDGYAEVYEAVSTALDATGLVDTVPPWTPVGSRRVVEGIDWLAGPGEAWVVDRTGRARRRCVVAELPAHRVDRVRGLLERAAERAEAAAGIERQLTVPWPGGARCPACGRRSLEVDVTVPQHRWWVVRCTARACRCSGPGCGCGQRVRYEGRAHAWPASEWEILADRLRVPGRPEVRSGQAGRGW